jgi:transcription termination factor Rho
MKETKHEAEVVEVTEASHSAEVSKKGEEKEASQSDSAKPPTLGELRRPEAMADRVPNPEQSNPETKEVTIHANTSNAPDAKDTNTMNSIQPRQEEQQRRHPRGQQRNKQRQPYHKGAEGRSYEQRGQQQQRNGDAGYSALEKLPLSELSLTELNILARRLGIIGAGLMTKEPLAERIKYVQDHPDMELEVHGVLEKLPDGFGFLRSAQYDYVSGPDDVYVSPSQIRRFGLRTGDMISGVIRKPKEGEKYFALLKINSVNDSDPMTMADRPNFERLTPEHPHEKFNLEFSPLAISTRIMDLFTPIGKGQRGLIVAPPKVGKTLLLKEMAKAIIQNHPDEHLMILLIDERPEEVADMKRTIRGTTAEVISSTFDEPAERHVQVAELVLNKAKRMVESGKHVVILLDSITRLARAYNTTAPASGKVLTGGIDANALQWPKRFFGAARTTEEGGSLTIIATALVDTGSRMDEVIYEEFKGTGNMEMHMTRKLSNRRIYPAFDLLMSGTRREDLLHTSENLNKVWVLQKFLSTMNTVEGMEFLIDKMRKHKMNEEFLDSINKRPTG